MTLLVGISNPDTADRLVRLGERVAREASSEILLTHVVTIAAQISLSTGRSSPEVIHARDLLQAATEAARARGVDVRALVEVARSMEDGLLAAADSHDAETILVGYSGQEAGPSGEEHADAEDRFDRTMYRVARKAKSNVVVAKFRREHHARILIPLATGAPLELTGALGRALSEPGATEVTFLHVSPPDESAERARNAMASRLDEAGLTSLGTLQVVPADDPSDAIVEVGADHDLVLLGPSNRPGLMDRIFSSRARTIAERVSASVVLAWGPPR